MKFSIGTDPEFMLSKNNHFFSAIGIVPGTKEERYEIGKHEFYYDNVLAECAIAPSYSKKEFIKNIGEALRSYAKLVSPYKLVAQASQRYPSKELEHPEAKKIGCDPEDCVYLMRTLKPPQDGFQNSTLRTSGGHVHLGSDVAIENAYFVVRMLDLFIGLPSIFIDHDTTSKERRKLYGKAGRCRLPAWGVEYRTLGNFWLNSPTFVELIYDVCEYTLDFVGKGKHLHLWSVDEVRLNSDEARMEDDFDVADCFHCNGYNLKDLRISIDNSDKRIGKKFWPLLEKLLPKQLYHSLFQLQNHQKFDLYHEWKIC